MTGAGGAPRECRTLTEDKFTAVSCCCFHMQESGKGRRRREKRNQETYKLLADYCVNTAWL